jgi:hypothetical protein
MTYRRVCGPFSMNKVTLLPASMILGGTVTPLSDSTRQLQFFSSCRLALVEDVIFSSVARSGLKGRHLGIQKQGIHQGFSQHNANAEQCQSVQHGHLTRNALWSLHNGNFPGLVPSPCSMKATALRIIPTLSQKKARLLLPSGETARSIPDFNF